MSNTNQEKTLQEIPEVELEVSDLSENENVVVTDVSNINVELKSQKKSLTEVTLELLSNELLKKLGEKNIPIKSETIVTIVRYAMEIVELYNLEGSSKKDFVINLIKKIGNEHLKGKSKEVINTLIETQIVENTIDLLVMATKGELSLNNLTEEKKEVVIDAIEETTSNCLLICLKAIFKSKTKN
jgi:hypothetical protein